MEGFRVEFEIADMDGIQCFFSHSLSRIVFFCLGSDGTCYVLTWDDLIRKVSGKS